MSESHSPASNLGPRLWQHARETLRLAAPVIVARVGIVGMTAASVFIIGRTDATQLAYYVLGGTLFDSLIAVTVGLLLGLPVLAARAMGAGRPQDCGAIWRRGLVYALLIGILLCAALQFAEPLLLATGQTAEIAQAGARVTAVLAFALPPLALYLVSSSLLEAIQRPLPGMIAMLIGNISNALFNLALVEGRWGLPALGATGSALATVFNFILLALGLGCYVRFLLPERHRLGLTEQAHDLWRGAADQRRYGYAAALSYGFEATSFSVMTLLVGLLGAVPLAAHGVTFQYLALAFMVAFAIATATQVRVSTAWGRGDRDDMALAGWTGLGLSMLCTGLALIVYASWPRGLVGLFTEEPAVVAVAVPAMLWVALALMFDGGQSVLNHACRGCGDTWVPTAFHFGSYFVVMIPLGALCAFTLGQGLAGIYQGITLASMLSCTFLALRFHRLSRACGNRGRSVSRTIG